MRVTRVRFEAGNAAVKTVSTEDVLNKAYRLAYFLHQDKRVAIQIVGAATLKLNVAMAVQSKRLYYVPMGRFSPGESRRSDGIRNKALFSDLHLLQRLVYVESEPYERRKERAAQVAPPGVPAAGDPASEDDLLVYFIKHLVRITTKRNAFYVTLGISRLLHSYSTLETMEIYNAVIGEPERVKDDYYYRSRKGVLMQEMYQRFGELIRACRQRRGEERFETQQGSSEQRSLVRECLRLFTPWDTQCPVPPDFDPLRSVIASLTSNSTADENRVEISRIHAILHPNCFEKLVAAFGYGAPGERMELPRFFFQKNDDDESPPQQRSAPADLTAEELAEINRMLAEQARRRRRSSSTSVIRIIVDGIERATLNPAEERSISFSAEEDAELIEVKTKDASGDLLLATHLLTSVGKDDDTVVASIRLEGGQQLSLSIKRRAIDASGGGDLLVEFGYRETRLGRATRLWWQRFGFRRNAEAGLSPRHILVAGVVLICVASYLGYVMLRSRQTKQPVQVSVVQPAPSTQNYPTPDGSSGAVDNGSASRPPRPSRSNRSKRPATSPRASDPSQTREEEVAGDLTRSGNAVPNLTLREVKKIYIDMRGATAIDQLRSNLIASLNSSGVVTAATSAGEADAALKIVVSNNSAEGQIEASAILVNARGTKLWPKVSRGPRYSGETTKVVSEMVRDLLSEIKLARGEH
jgi:hypothetical protein